MDERVRIMDEMDKMFVQFKEYLTDWEEGLYSRSEFELKVELIMTKCFMAGRDYEEHCSSEEQLKEKA